ncbi:MAG: aminotransferase class V-fold PLP-dependent enzyme [Phycisphaerales bacterium]
MRRLYLDNAATSFPKPRAVTEAMTHFATRLGASPGRGAYAESREAAELMWRCRERINTLINGESPEHVVFTLNTSDALNLAIRGLLDGRPRAHVVTTHMDHNSVLRPFNALMDDGAVEQTRVPVDPVTGVVDPQDIRRAIRSDTRLVAVVHASNVTGSLQPIGAIGRVCREAAVPLLVDAAQTIGHLPIDVQRDCIDLLAFPGHKGLLGPLGTGGLYIRPGLERMLRPVRWGGTGSVSESDRQPETMPDRYEPGSHNAIGLIGLSEGVAWILDRGIDTLWAHERELIRVFLNGLRQGDGTALPGLRLLGPPSVEDRVGVFSVTLEGVAPDALARRLEDEFGVLTRSGLHCAPLAHATFGTTPDHVGNATAGATRFSVGPFVNVEQVRYATDALAQVCHTLVGV